MGAAETSTKQQAEERIGTILREKWCLDQLLGIGGMAAVYSATHRNGKRAAIKILHSEAARIRDVRARFLREGYLANRVGHSGAVSILDDDVDADGNVYLVMELLEGETIEQRWQREERLPWAEVLVIADRVLDVLIAAHAKQIVHRDLKPGNIFLHGDGSIKILDFGIARLGALQPGKDDTGPHVSLGTPGFMPPEQARGRTADVDAQSDLWALGATMFAVLSGQHVHEADTANEQLLKAMTEPAEPLSTRAPDVPPAVSAIVDRALRFDKQERWPDAKTMQSAIRDTYMELLGEPISGALRLGVPVLRVSRSVQPDAPTLAADQPETDRLTTTRPVSDRSSRSIARTRLPIVIGVAVLAAAAIAIFLLARTGPTQTANAPPASAVASPSTPAPALEAHEPVVATTADTPPAAISASANALGPKLGGTKRVAKPPANPVRSAEPAPSAEIDIFTQRK